MLCVYQTEKVQFTVLLESVPILRLGKTTLRTTLEDNMLVNLTPHELNIHTHEGVVELPPSGEVARCSVSSEEAGELEGIPLSRTTLGKVEGLPAPRPGVWLIVSTLVRTACPDREDLLSPGPLVRDDNGQPIGCRGLVCN